MSNFNDQDFQLVEGVGGEVTYVVTANEEGNISCSAKYKLNNGNRVVVRRIYAGLTLGVSVSGAFFERFIDPPDVVIPVFILSDKEGYFGGNCPRCKRYFRTTAFQKLTYCPYCCYSGDSSLFLTNVHLKQIRKSINMLMVGLEKGVGSAIHLELPSINVVSLGKDYSCPEERQQTLITCRCGSNTDIIGLYGFCSGCGRRNSFDVLDDKLSEFINRVISFKERDRNTRYSEWKDMVVRIVSCFESFGRDLAVELSKLPSTSDRKKKILDINFHNPITAFGKIKDHLCIDSLKGITEKDQQFIRKRFLRRHVYEHCGGVADQEYIEKSGDPSVRKGELIRERSNNVETLIKLVQRVSENFFNGYESIK